ncbi:MAG: phenylalanine--tRNA ligase subunit alpha [Mycoplasmatales bacterium]
MENIYLEFENELDNIKDLDNLNDLRVKYLSKKGVISNLMADIIKIEDKKEYGNKVNGLKQKILKDIETLNDKFVSEQISNQLESSKIDVTLPGKIKKVGTQNLLLRTQNEIISIFERLGYDVVYGPEVETDYYNFEALNLDQNHPARDMQDTFYINPELVLRTHTSNSQSRHLSQNINQELKILCPGKTYRRDDDDATHSHQFMQVEGLVVVKNDSDADASLKTLKTTLTMFAKEIFNDEDLQIRMRPSYFPFTEPSVEVDVTCTECRGKGCNICKDTGFIEILGAGITHKEVLSKAGYDVENFTAFAFGIGIDRITMLKYSIEDIRHLYTNDIRFIKQFSK